MATVGNEGEDGVVTGDRRAADMLPDNVERERKFLVERDWSPGAQDDSTLITQAYVFAEDGYAVRIRRVQRDRGHEIPLEVRSTVTVKGPRDRDERAEYEMDIDPLTAGAIIARCEHVIVKRRFLVVSEGQTWDVDVFDGANEGLVLAELEGQAIRAVRKPWWALREVTSEDRFSNDFLAKRPFTTWEQDES